MLAPACISTEALLRTTVSHTREVQSQCRLSHKQHVSALPCSCTGASATDIVGPALACLIAETARSKKQGKTIKVATQHTRRPQSRQEQSNTALWHTCRWVSYSFAALMDAE